VESNYIDFATILIYLFWFFFFGLIVYIRREDKREGYPLVSDRRNVIVQGWPAVPPPKAERAKHPALGQWEAAERAAAPVAAPPPPPTPAAPEADPEAE